MEGITYPEHLAPGVSLDSGLGAGMLKSEPLPSLVHKISVVARPQVENRTSHWKPVINLVTDVNSEDLPTKVFPDPVSLEQSVLRALAELYYEQSYADVNGDMNTDLPESLAPMLKSLMVFEWPCVNSPLLPTLKTGIVNQTDATFDMDTDPSESLVLMINSDLSIVNWEDRFYRQSGCCGGDSQDIMNTDSSEPDVWKRIETADLIYTGRTATPSERWSNTNDNSDNDSVAELEYKTWDDACTWEFRNALGNAPPGLIQNPPTDIIRYYETDDNSDTIRRRIGVQSGGGRRMRMGVSECAGAYSAGINSESAGRHSTNV